MATSQFLAGAIAPSIMPTRKRLLHSKPWLLELLLLGSILLLYGALALPQLSLPGLYYDEAVDAVPAMELVQGRAPELLRGAGIRVFGHLLPLMAADYVGAVHTYAAVPFFAVFGVGTIPLRLMTVTGGALTLLATYFWARWLLRSRWIAAAAGALLAAHPSYLFFVRQGVHVSSLMALWAMLALLSLLAWRRTGLWWWLPSAGFSLGLGVSTKILFLWLIVALLIIYVVWRGAQVLWALLRVQCVASPPTDSALNGLGRGPSVPASAVGLRDRRLPRLLAAALPRALQQVATLAAFSAGAAIVIAYNMQTGGTLEVLQRNAEVSQYGVRNSEYLTNLVTRLGTLWGLLDGSFFWFLGDTYSNVLYPLAVALATTSIVVVLLLKPQSRRYATAAVFVAALNVLVLLQSPLTISGIWPTHLFLLLPLLSVLAALGLYLFSHYLLPSRGLWLGTALLGILVVSNVFIDLRYHNILRQTGGRGAHSDAIYQLASYLDSQGIAEPIAMDWGLRYNVQLLTKGDVHPLETFYYSAEPPEEFFNWLYGAVNQPGRLYLFHTPEHTTFPRFQAFSQLATTLNKEIRLDATIQGRDGTPVYLVYSAQ